MGNLCDCVTKEKSTAPKIEVPSKPKDKYNLFWFDKKPENNWVFKQQAQSLLPNVDFHDFKSVEDCQRRIHDVVKFGDGLNSVNLIKD